MNFYLRLENNVTEIINYGGLQIELIGILRIKVNFFIYLGRIFAINPFAKDYNFIHLKIPFAFNKSQFHF